MGKQKKHSRETPSTGEWRELQQRVRRKPAVTSAVRRRKLIFAIRGLAVAVIVAAIGGGLAYAWKLSHDADGNFAVDLPSEPLNEVVIDTDGVLDLPWFFEVTDVDLGSPLINVDIFAVKQALEADPQVKSAEVAREFPNTLRIVLNERIAIVKARVQLPDGSIERFVVAADGVVFPGRNWEPASLRRLPWLGGVRFNPLPGGKTFAPIPGMEETAILLAAARNRYPDIYKSISAVYLNEFHGDLEEPGAHIRLDTVVADEIYFLPGNYDYQLENLSQIYRFAQARDHQFIREIDLRLDDQVTVGLLDSPRPLKFQN